MSAMKRIKVFEQVKKALTSSCLANGAPVEPLQVDT